MRILHIASGDFFSTYGGGQVYVKNVVDCMIGMGFDIAVISFVDSNTGVGNRKVYNGVPLYETSSRTGEENLEFLIREISPDVIHAHSNKALACRIGARLHVPVVVTSHHGGILCPAGTRLNCKDEICHTKVNHNECLPCVLRNTRTGLRYWYPFMRHLPESAYDRLGRFLSSKPFVPFITPIGIASISIKNKIKEWHEIAEKCTCMVAPCREIARAMEENGLDSCKIKVVPHGIPLPTNKLDFPPVVNGKVKFFYVGRICYVKGIHILLDAFSKVNNPAIELHLIGGTGNKHEQRYMAKLQKLHRGDKRIIWHGKIAPDAVYEATRNYHVSSSSSFLEAFGLNIAEALALGKPVLATRSGGGEMQIQDGFNGWLVPPNNAEALSKKIDFIANHSEILPRMSRNCHATPIQEHCQNLFKIYSQCVKRF